MKNYSAIGLMSGTSMDGIDGTILLTNGDSFERTNINNSVKYDHETKNIILQAQRNPLDFIKNTIKFNLLNKLVTLDHFKVIKNILIKSKYDIDLIGFHGQTIYHSFEDKKSIQIGNPQLLSDMTKIKVVSSFRKNDIEQGGHGAPLSPIYHKAMANKMNIKLPVCFLNIGGVANITYYDGNNNLIGFDTGPGNGLMDFFCQDKLNKEYDENGQIASTGKVYKHVLNKLMSNNYFKKTFPKSLDKLFFINYIDELFSKKISNENTLATLSAFTVLSIVSSFNLLPKKPHSIILLGGGQHNKNLVKHLKKSLSINIFLSDELDIPGQFVEAELFAYLAARTSNKLPITYPLTTGVMLPLIGGRIFKPS